MKIAVIGGGASGMMVCASALKKHDITLFEKQSRVGRKLLATGNGRCNLSHENIGCSSYHGENPDFCRYALNKFNSDCVLQFFHSIGLVTVSESEKIYPLSNSSNSVVDSLRLYICNNGVDIKTDSEVTAIKKNSKVFSLFTDKGKCYSFDKVVVCAGGKAGGKVGGTDKGYNLLTGLGHSLTPLFPSLVQLKTDNTFTKSLKGVRAEAYVSLVENHAVTTHARGEVQFADYGISGPVIFEISRSAVLSVGGTLVLDFMPDYSKVEIVEMLKRKQDCFATETLENLLTGMLHNRLGRTIVRYCGYHLDEAIACLNFEDMQDIADGIKCFELSLTGNLGFENAQVTAGGIRTAEFCDSSLESRIVPGLYAAGEILDIDGDCGGYNLQWAWSSGMLVGISL